MLQQTHYKDKDRTTARTAIKGFQILIFSACLLLIFNSDGLRSAVRDLPANKVTDTLVISIDTWHGWMEAIGTDRVIEILRLPFSELRKLKWTPEQNGEI